MKLTTRKYRRALLAIAGALFLLSAATACSKAGGQVVQRTSSSEGDPAAQVVIMAFTDFQCSQCKQLADEVMPQIIEEYVDSGVARVQHRHNATIGEESVRAAMAAECAGEQGYFRPYYDGLFDMQGAYNSGAFSDEALRGLAQSVGLDEGTFTSCMDSGRTRATVDTDINAAAAAGIAASPALVINGIIVTGVKDYVDYQTAIGQAWIAID